MKLNDWFRAVRDVAPRTAQFAFDGPFSRREAPQHEHVKR